MATNGDILLAYDGSDGAKAAIEAATRLFPGCSALVVSVWQSVAAAAPASLIAVPAGVARKAYAELDEEAQREAQELAEDGAAAARAGGLDAAARGVLCHGNTWATLVRLAEDERPAAIVVGSRGRSAVKSALLGSVSSGVAHHSSVPVMIVPSPAGELDGEAGCPP